MPEQPRKPTMKTNIAELRVYIREKPTDEACCAGGGMKGVARVTGKVGIIVPLLQRERECKYDL